MNLFTFKVLLSFLMAAALGFYIGKSYFIHLKNNKESYRINNHELTSKSPSRLHNISLTLT